MQEISAFKVFVLFGFTAYGLPVEAPLSLHLKWGDNGSDNYYLCNRNPDKEITWIDYYGSIPSNAIIAGTKKDGSNVYIGQVYHARDDRGIGIAPVEIFQGKLEVQVADAYKIYQQKIMIKILTGVKDVFEWVYTDIDTPINKITKNTLVRGGHQHHYGQIYEYIGRVRKNGETFIGRAMLDTTDSAVKGLQLIYNNNGVYTIEKSGFQVLSVKNNVLLCSRPENQIYVIMN